ncbi:D-alanine--D-alanine ligase [Candidatus Saccharibacteria bacterium]|nr:D-alanine--D-alanine ligase [Candidatus Saccharibacteria bacterium]
MKTIAVIFGSRSAEHDISIVTALSAIIKPLEATKKYKIEAVYIAKDGSWYWDEKLKDIKLYQSGAIDEFMRKAPKVQLQFDNGLTLVKSSQFAGRKAYKKIDVVFPATHGTHGEDGELMGLLEMANVPYVGCDVPSSAVAMDKVLSKLQTQAYGIVSPKMKFFTKSEYSENVEGWLKAIKTDLKMPLFVKPARLGSSIGITRVENEKELVNAIEVALHYDEKALVEEAVANLIEVTVPIIGNDELIPASVEQPLPKDDGVFDFETKYMNQGKGGKKMSGGKAGAQGYSKIPADISKDLYDKSLETALGVYKAVGCQGIARIDLLIDSKAKKVYFNEINPLPGSLYNHNWRASGWSNVDLVTRLVDLAEERWNAKQKLTTTFSTNFLKQF